jgi:hypothetical protein
MNADIALYALVVIIVVALEVQIIKINKRLDDLAARDAHP